MLILVWRKLCIFGLWGPPPLPLFRNYLEEGFYHSLLEGLLLILLSLSLPLHSASLVLEELFSILVPIENSLTGSFRRRKVMRT